MNKEQLKQQAQRQIKELLNATEKSLLIKLDKAIKSDAIPESYFSDNYLFSKALFNSFTLEKPFEMLHDVSKQEQLQLHKIL